MNYKSKLDLVETEVAIKYIKDIFERELADALHLIRVSAPLFVIKESGLNDNLNGVEEPVHFKVKGVDGNVEIVHSLAKWKREALARYQITSHKGIYTDMNAIRKDEKMDAIHSIYVDQWDYEAVIDKKERNLDLLFEIVGIIRKHKIGLDNLALVMEGIRPSGESLFSEEKQKPISPEEEVELLTTKKTKENQANQPGRMTEKEDTEHEEE